jgi:RimJ/RimL family protein N-acetyltransferase
MSDLAKLQLETPRLILRPTRLDDLDAWATFWDDEIGTKFIGGRQSRSMAWRNLMTMCGCWHTTGVAMFSVFEKATGKWVGRVGPWHPEGWPQEEIGWGISREHWGKGYASEGAAAAMDYAFFVLGWPEVIHCIHEDNEASKGVARKLGSQYLRRVQMPQPYAGQPVDAWGQTREEWKSRARP